MNRTNIRIQDWLSDNQPCTELVDLSDEEYFAEYDRYITAHKLVSYNRDPIGFFEKHDDGPPSDALVFGSAAHKLMLEGAWAFAETFHVYHDRDVYSATGRFCGRNSKKWAAVCEAAGFSPDRTLHSREYELLRMMQLSFLASDHSHLIDDCRIERCVRWCSNGLRWQCKMDAYNPNHHYIVDLKTTRSISDAVASIGRYGYDIQSAVYSIAYDELYGEWPDFYFLFVEKEAPYRVFLYAMDRMILEPMIEDVYDICERLVDDIKRRMVCRS